MDHDSALRLLEELKRLVANRETIHQLNQHLSIPHSDIIVSPVQMNRFPRFEFVFFLRAIFNFLFKGNFKL